nr:hypothetical protein [uncultured Clostridium sp.]
MDLNSLDLTLRSLSTSEKKYKSGYIPDFWDYMPKIKIGGETVNCIYFEEKHNMMEKHSVLSGWQSTSLDISIKKIHGLFRYLYMFTTMLRLTTSIPVSACRPLKTQISR